MLKTVLPPACYTEQSWFDLEREKLFGELWLFAGFTYQLSVDNSFITRRLNGMPVLVQNCKGQIRAFRNACAHRGMPIQTEPCGTRKMICPYHGWGYDGEGALRGVPNGTLYGMCQAEKDELRLQGFAVVKIGIFVFVNLSAEPINIDDQYDEAVQRALLAISANAAPQASYTHFEKRFNWKLNFENILDWNHFQFIHPNSFAALLEYEPSGALKRPNSQRSHWFGPEGELGEVQMPSGHQDLNQLNLRDISRVIQAQLPYEPRWFSSLIEHTADPGAFLNLHLFPNLNIGSLNGETFYVQQLCPASPNTTDVHSWVFTARLKPDAAFAPHLLWGMHHAEMNVIQEDAVLLVQLQEALESADTVGVLGSQENHLAAMGIWYMNHLKGTTEQ